MVKYMNVMTIYKMTRMNIHDEVHLEVITMYECNDYSKMTRTNIHERMH